MTRNDRRCLVQYPQVTSHSPKREPIVTGMGRRMNLVSNCIVLTARVTHTDGSCVKGQSS